MTSFRLRELAETAAGLRETGMPLVAWNGHSFRPAGFTDDVGVYYFVPKIAAWFHLDVEQGARVFFGGIALFSLVLGIVGMFILFRRWRSRAVAVAGFLLLVRIAFSFNDVYVVSFALPVAYVPWILYLFGRCDPKPYQAFLALPAVFLIGVAHHIRSHAGTAVLVFLIVIVLFHHRSGRVYKASILLCIAAGIIGSAGLFDSTLSRRDAYLAIRNPGYERVEGRHPFWHSVYIGFGFLNNRHGIVYKDEFAAENVHSVSPNAKYVSPEYERILKNKVMALIREDHDLVLATMFAKAGVILMFLLKYANVGLLAARLRPKPAAIEGAFVAGLAVSALPGLLVIPFSGYLLGFVAFSALYGIVSICHAFEDVPGAKAEGRP